MTEPTDAELDAVLCKHWPAFSMQATLVRMWVRAAMRDAIAKWGTPPVEQTSITPETGNSVSAQGAAITSESGKPPAEQQAATKAAPGEPDGFGSAEHWKEKAQYWAGVAHRLRGEALRGEPVDGIVHPPAPQQEAQEPCPSCAALARTVMLDQVSFDPKPDCYGIRQITNDEGVEEWEDIRTSLDVARKEAKDMMATGRGGVYEVVPLWATPQLAPQPAPAPMSEDVVKDAARWRVVALIGNEVMLHPEKRTQAAAVKAYMDATHSGLDLTGAVDAALAAQGGK